MRSISKWLSLLLILCLCCPLTAIAAEEDDGLSDTIWIATQYSNEEKTVDVNTPEEALEQGAVVKVQFADDGTYQWDVIHADGTFTLNGTWLKDGEEVTLKLGDTDLTYTLNVGEDALTYSGNFTVLFQQADETALTAIAAIEAQQEENRIPPVAASSSDYFSGTSWYATGIDWDLFKLFMDKDEIEFWEYILGFVTFVRNPSQLNKVLCGFYLDLDLYSNHTYTSRMQLSVFGDTSDMEYSYGKWSSSGTALYMDDSDYPFYYSYGVLDVSVCGFGLYMQQK